MASRQHFGESLVLVGEEPGSLAFSPLSRGAIHARSTYLEHQPSTIEYEEGRDFIADREAGTIRRSAKSRIPDFTKNKLYGQKDFDHSKFPGYGNLPFFVFVDYTSNRGGDWPLQSPQAQYLQRSRELLGNGGAFKIVAFGDSITAGGEATQPRLIYWQRWAEFLKKKYPRARISAINGATGGDTTQNGLARLEEKVLKEQPDLVLLAFGMNDNNIPPFGVALETFQNNLGSMIDRIRARTKAEIVVISAFPPNPLWHFGSKQMGDYARVMADVASQKHCACADVYHNWLAISARKKPEDMLGNNINHPNDFGHWVYFEVLNRLGL